MKKPANATELLGVASETFCLDVASMADLRAMRGKQWKWKRGERLQIEKRHIVMTRGEAIRAAFCTKDSEK